MFWVWLIFLALHKLVLCKGLCSLSLRAKRSNLDRSQDRDCHGHMLWPRNDDREISSFESKHLRTKNRLPEYLVAPHVFETQIILDLFQNLR